MEKKILPIKIWLDEESCWDNKPQGDGYTEYVHESYHAQALLHVLNKGVEQGRKEMLEKACKWLKENKDHPFIGCEDPCLSGYLTDKFIKDFRKAMEDEE